MTDLTVTDVRGWIGAADWNLSRRFYAALGCHEVWVADDGGLALLELGGCRFYLQDHYVTDWCLNTMVTVAVDDAAAWHRHVSAVLADGSFGDARVAEPVVEAWGATVTYVWDPSGVLLHLAQFAA